MSSIPVGEIFYRDVLYGRADWSLRRFLDVYIQDEVFEHHPIETVEVENIVPTQRCVNEDNLASVYNVGNDTDTYLIECKGLFYVIDGHHRIASEILRGNPTIKAFVIHVT